MDTFVEKLSGTRRLLLPAALVLLTVLLSGTAVFGRGDPFPRAAAAYLVQVDGSILWSREPARRLPPASLAKLMTALLALERLSPGAEVAVSAAAARETGTRLGLREKERFRAGDLLAAMLVASANDACRALADALAPEARFTAMMNERARQWGMHDSHFTNGCGHDDGGTYSSAADLAILADHALAHPAIRGLAALPGLAIVSAGGRTVSFTNTNALIGRFPGITGLKTGFTPQAGKCLIASAEREGRRVLLVMLDAANRWWDAEDILRLALAHGALPE
ncbi:MAG: serine hydrolase [Thermodesulfobacteriota bacterium]